MFSAPPYESRFRGEEDFRSHPIEVWEHFKSMVKLIPMTQTEKVKKFALCLRDDALDWYKAVAYQYKDLEALKQAFLAEFWGPEHVGKMVARLHTETIQGKFGETRLQHFHKWYRWSKFIKEIGIAEEKILKTLKGHFPNEVTILTAAANTVEAIEDMLKLVDKNSPIERVNFNIHRNDPRNIDHYQGNRNNRGGYNNYNNNRNRPQVEANGPTVNNNNNNNPLHIQLRPPQEK